MCFKYYKKHSCSGLVWSPPHADCRLSRPTSVLRITLVCAKFYPDRLIFGSTRVRNLFLSKNRDGQAKQAIKIIYIKYEKSIYMSKKCKQYSQAEYLPMPSHSVQLSHAVYHWVQGRPETIEQIHTKNAHIYKHTPF